MCTKIFNISLKICTWAKDGFRTDFHVLVETDITSDDAAFEATVVLDCDVVVNDTISVLKSGRN